MQTNTPIYPQLDPNSPQPTSSSTMPPVDENPLATQFWPKYTALKNKIAASMLTTASKTALNMALDTIESSTWITTDDAVQALDALDQLNTVVDNRHNKKAIVDFLKYVDSKVNGATPSPIWNTLAKSLVAVATTLAVAAHFPITIPLGLSTFLAYKISAALTGGSLLSFWAGNRRTGLGKIMHDAGQTLEIDVPKAIIPSP
jgi:hypothetical protein